MPTFGERLRQLRKERNVKQSHIAELLNITERTVRFYENGEREPTISQSRQLAKSFGVSVDYLSGESDERQTKPLVTNDPDIDPEEAEFLKWVKEKVTSSFFYDWHQSQNKDEYMDSLRLIWKLEKGRKPGQKQGEPTE